MLGRTDLGPACPDCDSDAWRLVDPGAHFHREGGIPVGDVTAEGSCTDCGATFYLDLELPADSVWRGTAVPADRGPLVGFGWLDDRLHAWGVRDGDDQYCETYRLVDVWTLDGE